jgi:hypothetical protein
VQQIVISYRRQDSEAITGRIFDRLTANYGKDAIFRDIDNIPAGSDFRQHFDAVLRNSNLLIVIVGPRWLGHRAGHARIEDETDPVRIEIETALDIGIPVVPILVGNARMPPAARLPERIREFAFRNALKVDSGQDFEFHIARLVKSMDALLAAAGQPSGGIDRRRDTAPSGKRRFFGSRLVGIVAVLAVAAAVAMTIIRVRSGQETSPRLATDEPKPPPIESTPESERENALKQGTLTVLEAYIRKFPNDPRNSELWDRVFALRRAEYTEWTIFDVAVALDAPAFLQFSSIKQVDKNKFEVLSKIPLDASASTYVKDVPKGSIQEALDVYDCQENKSWGSEVTYYSPSGDKIYHYKWAEPNLVSAIVTPTVLAAGSLASSMKMILCNDWLRTPSISKGQLKDMDFISLSSTPQGDGDLFYKIVTKPYSAVRNYIIVAKFQQDKKFAEIPGTSAIKAFGDLTYRTMVQSLEIKCDEDKFFSIKVEYFDEKNNLVSIAANANDAANAGNWAKILDKSPFGLLRRSVCADN